MLHAALAVVLSRLPLAMQDAQIRSVALRKQPFVVARTIQGSHATDVNITVHLSDAISPLYRIHKLRYTVPADLTEGDASTCASQQPDQQGYTFTTQHVMYDLSQGAGSSSAATPSTKWLRT